MDSTALVSRAGVASTPAAPITAAPRLVHANSPIVLIFSQSSQRIPALDGLRGVAILLVLLRHSVAGTETSSRFWSIVLESLRLSWSGVDLFFVLSGFLIGGILLDARHSPHYFRTFYIRRAFRILPVYYVFLAVYFVRHLPIRLLPGPFGDTSPLPIPWLSFITFTHNFWMAGFGWFGPWAIAPTWSLAIEEQFYVTVPFFIRIMRTRALYIGLACVIIGTPVLRVILPRVMQHGAFANYVLMPCRADALSLGLLAALLYRSTRFREWIKKMPWILHASIAITFATIIFLTYWAWDQYRPPMATWGLSCLALFYVCVLLSVVCAVNPALQAILRFSPLTKLGKVAYCTYLIHAMLIQAARAVLRSYTSLSSAQIWSAGGAIGLVLALIIASLSWKFLEKPLLSYGHTYEY
jgi:peptidoglycan/LPS O-acetylase OafA/YrhL